MQQKEIVQMHWDVARLLSLGVSEDFMMEDSMTPLRAKELLKGLLYLQERYGQK